MRLLTFRKWYTYGPRGMELRIYQVQLDLPGMPRPFRIKTFVGIITLGYACGYRKLEGIVSSLLS